MQEQQIRVSTVVSAALWMLGIGLVLVGMVIGREGVPELGVLAGVAAAVTRVHEYFADQEDRIRDAFEMGRDHERGVRIVR